MKWVDEPVRALARAAFIFIVLFQARCDARLKRGMDNILVMIQQWAPPPSRLSSRVSAR